MDSLVLPRLGWVPTPWPRGWLTGIVAVSGLLLAGAVPPLRYRRWRYALRDRELWIRHGILWVRVSVIPYRRVQFVDTEQGPVERLLGLAQLVVHTASPGTAGWIPGLDAGQAEKLRERLARMVPEDEDPS